MKNVRIFSSVVLMVALCFSASPAWAGGPTGKSDIKQEIKQPEFKKGELLIKFRRGVASGRAAQIKDRAGLTTLKNFPRLGVHHVRIAAPDVSVREAAKRLNVMPEVLYAEPNYKLFATAVPNDPQFSNLWGMNNIGQSGGLSDADIDALEAWDISTGSSSVVVGVIDTGVDYTHEDLAANMWTNPGETPENGIDDDGNGYIDDIYGIDAANGDSDPFDDNGHGSHCSGTIGGVGNNGIGVAGVNWNVKIMALKFLGAGGSGWTSDAVTCLDYAVMMKTTYGVNIKLTSNSWGGGGSSQTMIDAIAASAAEGMLFIAAAGNSSSDNDVSPHYPSNYDSDSVVAVASTDHNDNMSSFSSYGATTVDLGAPGSSILSTTPGNAYSYYSGTSMATPHVAGAAALLWAADPTLTGADVKETLLGTVDAIPALDGKVLSGGRLNVMNAITCSPDTVNFNVSLTDGFLAEQGAPRTLSARLSACTFLRGATVSAQFSNGDPGAVLADDGVAPDVTADDGIYTAEWTPDVLGPVTVNFTADHLDVTYTASATSEVMEFAGYYYDDTVPFNWIDISATGTPLFLMDDDHAFLSIPFQLSFYDSTYDQISIGSNGRIYFQNSAPTWLTNCIPGSTADSINTFVAGFWDDFDPSTCGQVYFEVRGMAPGRMLIVQYDNVPSWDVGGKVSFQVIMYEYSDGILVQYRDVDFGFPGYDAGGSAVVGVQRDASYGQQYSCFEPVLSNEMAILWYRQLGVAPEISLHPASISNSNPQGVDATVQGITVWNSGSGTLSYSITDDAGWLSCDPAGGTSTGEADSITVYYNTSGLGAGTYSATITFSDPTATNNPHSIPVTLTVNPDPNRLQIYLQSPPNYYAFSSPPTFTWTSTGGGNNRFAVDLTSDEGAFNWYWSTYENLNQPISGNSWTIPRTVWNGIPSGSWVWWRVRGRDITQNPLDIGTSGEVGWFYKY